MLYREFDKRIGFSKSIEAHLRIKDKRLSKVHTNASMITQKFFQILAGNGADDCADSLQKHIPENIREHPDNSTPNVRYRTTV